MKTLIAEDEFTSRLLLQELLKKYGPCHIAVNGKEAVEAVRLALEVNAPYKLICLDINMPEMTGHEALQKIRLMEKEEGIAGPDRVKVIMTTVHADEANVLKAYEHQCDHFLVKPVLRERLMEVLCGLGLIN